MARLKFSLSSEQLELLLAFESAQGLNHLAEIMARDPSVVSRNLQRIAEELPVLEKIKGRWELTTLGIQVNALTKEYLHKQMGILAQSPKSKPFALQEKAVLIVINAQKALLESTQEKRNNSEAEENIAKLLAFWRARGRPIVHVKHVSENENSLFYRGSKACEFLPVLAPHNDEVVIEKMKSSSFAGTSLEDFLVEKNYTELVLVGFTANECIDATAKDAAAKEFTSFVVGDATATFDLRDPNGKWVKAERIHKLTLANIHAFYAQVINTNEALG